eukprot:CAMPEP_0202416934 /NCGR_PEP_ID=MMETSP1128-20130828/41261_1 /ASSEMBLY_ACC=CAM_ASM_000463 /TAXON_ID=3047 /ORGANISM="Dunaliella tertiolecta, Strain CCMP1320" /LENGTH=120 /DNA_ID=CAMNT_0049024091 /DNA_START=45 /DNA_END=407 /DNA_ORIENTATION=+
MELLPALFEPMLPGTPLPVEWNVGWRAEGWAGRIGVVVAEAAAAPLHMTPLLWHVTGALAMVRANLAVCWGVVLRALWAKVAGTSCVLLLLLLQPWVYVVRFLSPAADTLGAAGWLLHAG